MSNATYLPMRDIGSDFGLTSHAVGKVLTQNGFRNDGKPTKKAFDSGWVQQRFAPGGINYIWAWNVENTRSLLESLGHEREQEKLRDEK